MKDLPVPFCKLGQHNKDAWKPLPRMGTFSGVLVLAIALPSFVAISLAHEQKKAVTIASHGIIIHPSVQLSKEDEKALDDILHKFDKKLYRVQRYDKGKLTKDLGEMKLNRAVEADLEATKQEGTSDSMGLFATLTIPHRVKSETDAAPLLEQIEPILQKYDKP